MTVYINKTSDLSSGISDVTPSCVIYVATYFDSFFFLGEVSQFFTPQIHGQPLPTHNAPLSKLRSPKFLEPSHKLPVWPYSH